MLENLQKQQEEDAEKDDKAEQIKQLNILELNKVGTAQQANKKQMQLLQSGTMDEGTAADYIPNKFQRLTYRSGRGKYNQNNITSTNECVAVDNYR